MNFLVSAWGENPPFQYAFFYKTDASTQELPLEARGDQWVRSGIRFPITTAGKNVNIIAYVFDSFGASSQKTISLKINEKILTSSPTASPVTGPAPQQTPKPRTPAPTVECSVQELYTTSLNVAKKDGTWKSFLQVLFCHERKILLICVCHRFFKHLLRLFYKNQVARIPCSLMDLNF